MKFKIPFTFLNLEVLKKRSETFVRFTKGKGKLNEYLTSCGVDLDRAHYLAICYYFLIVYFLIFSVMFTLLFGILSLRYFYLYGEGLALLISGFIFMNQVNYPRIFSLNKSRNIEKNLIPVMQDVLVQLNSGVPLFQIILNIANSDYGEVSEEFKKIVKEINSGTPQIEAIEHSGKINNSLYFRRVLWQMSNAMRSGGDISIVIKEGVKNLIAEQSIQVQSYGSKLNPLIMFYMLIAVILPSLGITFLIIISSMLNVSGDMLKILFIAIFVTVAFIQIMFLGLIKSRRPSLM